MTAYDAETGKQLWRFYTVPGDPAKAFENEGDGDGREDLGRRVVEDTAAAAPSGTRIAYDPEADLVYIGIGNGAPWNHQLRSPGDGDNLFLASIVARRTPTPASTLALPDHPGDTWDYRRRDHDAGRPDHRRKPRKVLMQAPKNGFFYVIDRVTGKLISAEKLAKVTWAPKST